MIICKECFYWGRASFDEPDLHYCLLARKWLKNEKAFTVVDGDPYSPGIIATGPDFSCIHATKTEYPKH